MSRTETDETGNPGAAEASPEREPDEARGRLLLGSANDWFSSALRSMLEPEGYLVRRARSSEEILSGVARGGADLVIVDQGLPSTDVPELARMLGDGPLPRHVPLLYHSSGGGRPTEEVKVLEAGAWGLLHQPLRPATLVAQLDRYLRLGRQMQEKAEDRRYVDPETDVLTLTGLMRVLPALSNLAHRRGAPVSYTVLGPTEPGSGRVLEKQRRSTARLCRRQLRKSDFVGWLQEDSDLAVVTYGTARSGAGGLARRLNELTEKETRAAELRYTLSAGILQMDPSRKGPEARNGGNGGSPETETKLESLHALAAAQTALKKARSAGGGIRYADVT